MEPDEIAEAFDELHTAGKVLEFGVSNQNPLQMKRIARASKYPLAANQIQLSVAFAPAFEAMLTPTMTKAVTNVRVEIPGSLNATTLTWDATDGIYKVAGGTDDTDDYWMGNFWSTDGTYLADDRRANETRVRLVSPIARERVGYTLIAPPGNSMTVTVKYMQADNADAAFSERVIEGVVINFKDASNNAISLGAGDAYTVRFYFDNYDIELVGQKRPWEDGGFISVPIQIR